MPRPARIACVVFGVLAAAILLFPVCDYARPSGSLRPDNLYYRTVSRDFVWIGSMLDGSLTLSSMILLELAVAGLASAGLYAAMAWRKG